jgi:hypothetical protein
MVNRTHQLFFHLIALSVDEVDGIEDDPSPSDQTISDPGYAIWFYLDKDQSCFVELHSGHPSRQPELYHTILPLLPLKILNSNVIGFSQ